MEPKRMQKQIKRCRIMQHRWIGLVCLCFLVPMAGGVAWAFPQDQEQKPAISQPELDAFQAADQERNPQTRIKLLDAYSGEFPALGSNAQCLPRLLSHCYFALKSYTRSIEYADKLSRLGTRSALETRLEAMITRVQAYVAGCGDSAFQTPESYVKEKESATQGLANPRPVAKPTAMPDTQFANQKMALEKLFNSAGGNCRCGAERQGNPASCKTAPAADKLDHVINGVEMAQEEFLAAR